MASRRATVSERCSGLSVAHTSDVGAVGQGRGAPGDDDTMASVVARAYGTVEAGGGEGRRGARYPAPSGHYFGAAAPAGASYSSPTALVLSASTDQPGADTTYSDVEART